MLRIIGQVTNSVLKLGNVRRELTCSLIYITVGPSVACSRSRMQ
jgi:hypothetical protein